MVTLERASERHVRTLRGELRADATTGQYAMVERLLALWLSERLGRPPTVADLSPELVGDWAADLRATGRSKESARQYLSIAKRWSAFLARTYNWGADPLAGMRTPRRTLRPVEVFTEQDVARMLDAIGRSHAEVRLRNRAAILVLLDTGLRVSELCGLALGDVTLPTRGGEGAVRIRHGKGNTRRDGVLKSVAGNALALYIEDERPSLADKAPQEAGAAVFLASDGHPWSRQAAWKLVQGLGERAGVEGKRVSPHTFRATFATLVALAGNSPYRLQDAMGHADASTTARYVSAAELRKVPFVSPLERWKSVR